MAKIVRIRTMCDGCAAEGRDNDVDTETYGPVEGRTVDLCPEHRVTLWDPLVEFFRTYGETPTKVRKRTTATVARVVHAVPDPAHPAPGRKRTRRAGRKERARREALAAAQVPASSEGHPCPLCAVVCRTTNSLQVHLSTQHGTSAGAVFGGVCPVCNHEGTPQGLGVHARMAHGVADGVPGLFRQGTALGDPYGVIAARAGVVAAMLGATG